MKCSPGIHFEITPYFVLFLCGLLYLDKWGLFPMFLLAAFCHELGHAIACTIAGAPITHVRLGMTGAIIKLPPMSYSAECLCALAGPLTNLILCLALLRFFPIFSLLNLFLAFYNLLPIPPLDGGRALRCLLLMALPPDETACMMRLIQLLLWISLAAVAWYLSVQCRLGAWAAILFGLLALRSESELLVAKRQKNA